LLSVSFPKLKILPLFSNSIALNFHPIRQRSERQCKRFQRYDLGMLGGLFVQNEEYFGEMGSARRQGMAAAL